MEKLIVEHRIDAVVHLSALLSAIGEEQPHVALEVNNVGTQNVLELSRRHNLTMFCPSTIGAFGPTTPSEMTPDVTVMRPNTIYGVTKVHMELLGEYYHSKYGVDFRSLRLPGIISADSEPGGGTTDYAVGIFHHLFEKPGEPFHCYLHEDTALPMMEIGDCVDAITQFMDADDTILTQRTYNLAAASFTPKQLSASIRRHVPDFEIVCESDSRQAIADSWLVLLQRCCASVLSKTRRVHPVGLSTLLGRWRWERGVGEGGGRGRERARGHRCRLEAISALLVCLMLTCARFLHLAWSPQRCRPDSFDDQNARRDWGWQHKLDTDGMVDFMIGRLSEIHGKGPC